MTNEESDEEYDDSRARSTKTRIETGKTQALDFQANSNSRARSTKTRIETDLL